MVRLRDDRELTHVEVRDRLEPRQPLLLALGHRPVLEGIASRTRIGRVRALCWGLAFGVGELPPEAVVGFESCTLRFCTAAAARVSRLDGPSCGGRWRACGGGAAGRRLLGAHRAAGGPLVTDLAGPVGPAPGFERRRPFGRPKTIRGNRHCGCARESRRTRVRDRQRESTGRDARDQRQARRARSGRLPISSDCDLQLLP